MHRACYYGKQKIVRLLLENGANVDKKNKNEETPFFSACGANLSIAKLLIEKGAKINTKNYRKATPLINAAYNGKINIVKYLVSLKVDLNESNDCNIHSFIFHETPLFNACISDNFEIAR